MFTSLSLLYSALGVILGTIVFVFNSSRILYPSIITLLVSVLAFTSLRHKKKEILSLLIFFLLSFFNFNLRSEHLEYFDLENFLNAENDYRLEIVNEPRYNSFFQSEFIVEVKSSKFSILNSLREVFLPYRFFARTNKSLGLDKGDLLELCNEELYKKGSEKYELKKLTGFKAKVLKKEKVFYELKNKNLSYAGTKRDWIIELQDSIKNYFLSSLSKDNASIVSSLIMGSRVSTLPEDFVRNVRLLGLGHFFAASGFHLLILTLFIGWILSKTKISKRNQTLITLLSVFIYSALAGFSPSIIRAGVFISFVLILELFNRKLLSLKFLVLLAGLVLFIDPYTILDIGFQFSYLATFGILLWSKPIKEKFKSLWVTPKYLEFFLEILIVTLSVQIIVLPFVIYYFGTLQIWSVLANLIFSPFLSLLLLLSFLGLSFLLEPLLNSFKFLLSFTENLPGINSDLEITGASLFFLILLFNYLSALYFLNPESMNLTVWMKKFFTDNYLKISLSASLIVLLCGINLEPAGLKKIEYKNGKFTPGILEDLVSSKENYKYFGLEGTELKGLVLKNFNSIEALGDFKNDIREVHLLLIPHLKASDIYLDTIIRLTDADFVMVAKPGKSKRAIENLEIISRKANTIVGSGELYISGNKFWKIDS